MLSSSFPGNEMALPSFVLGKLPGELSKAGVITLDGGFILVPRWTCLSLGRQGGPAEGIQHALHCLMETHLLPLYQDLGFLSPCRPLDAETWWEL